ncbi:Plasmodium exported protein, unknown function [Plasmodium knowlesi strain H]|uniref:Plasmodium RESA N-terminal domain-containing protein n=3 Tax=Plasmodium knowlesi TaxID=5850 RepID=A0A5K1TY63_PLAKH|nr:Plasmodium exported protein (PHIST), unknown function [Plasmodium knowlesi strain H]OTN67431.1 Uncharacterized protein PKNOH_S06436900 [Plasmodium knowlesi]CAA9987639.1 Plasmodium exported protein (PHIST), unknown function [Plasmodium knowlesi strain H]SBO26958.1 Plasmodium exported protein, unknown function [Plasmodium knowlesi strain H]SBO29276.1 Plasmodium exported protein, unknown function [Plasmodium knowlesi strain H]VVS77113.1 Plasmodium exported protein (PHIST), unknown function [Pl|eukprot:XP_002258638.1 hypothetical protein, conserved in Plasmodium species [Plasmodium knowlesi strain H]
MQDCRLLKPIQFYPLKFLIGKSNKLRKDSIIRNSLSGQGKITDNGEKRGTFSVSTFFNTVLWVFVLSLFYILIQNVHCPGWPGHSYGKFTSLWNGRRWRNLSGRIPSHVKGFRRLYLTEEGEKVIQEKKCSVKDKDLSSQIRRMYENIEINFPEKYKHMLTEREKKRCVENVMLFKNDNSQEMTDEELNERIGKLKGPVDSATMLYVWHYVYDHERKKCTYMVEDMRRVCRVLAEYYNVPWEYEIEKYKYVLDKMTKMLLKREKFEIKNIKMFATDEPICARWEFQRYLKLKQRSWADFTHHMWRKCTKKLEHSFRNYKNMETFWM